jgi:hypothetical protein
MSSLLVSNRVYRMEMQFVMLVFLTPLIKLFPLYLLSELPRTFLPSQRQCVAVGWGVGGGGVELCCRPYSAGF